MALVFSLGILAGRVLAVSAVGCSMGRSSAARSGGCSMGSSPVAFTRAQSGCPMSGGLTAELGEPGAPACGWPEAEGKQCAPSAAQILVEPNQQVLPEEQFFCH
jgi:hypothetical protein